jgi:HD-GYP domain-containing protein (c-di-GMP phosphodiesterase class II)
MGWVFLVDSLLAPIGLLAALAATASPPGFLLALPLVLLLAIFAKERSARIDNALELSHAYRGTAFLLGDVVEADDAYTGSHSRDVVELVLAVADELALDSRERRRAELAALLHDVGKIRIPNEIINKTGALDPEERALINTHTIEGQRLLERVGGLLGEVGIIVRSCHERFDGNGYPDALAGEDIPLVARVICCCDALNAMTTNRPYRKALLFADALAELERGAGSQFDPLVVDALVRVVTSQTGRRAG